MLWTELLIASVVLSVGLHRIKASESKEGSGFDINNRDLSPGKEDDEWEERNSDHSGDEFIQNVPRVTVSVKQRHPPSSIDDEDPVDEEEDDLSAGGGGGGGGKNGGGGFVFESQDSKPEEAVNLLKEPVPVKENSLITHPGILAAIIVGGVLVLVCLIIFFILIICCIRKKDEGMYDLDRAMKEKLKYITYTKADASEKEFFA